MPCPCPLGTLRGARGGYSSHCPTPNASRVWASRQGQFPRWVLCALNPQASSAVLRPLQPLTWGASILLVKPNLNPNVSSRVASRAGVVLLPASTLGAAKIKDGSKVMLMSSKGGVQSAGQAAAAAAAADKQRKLAAAAALLPTAVDDHPDVARRSSGPQASSAQQVRLRASRRSASRTRRQALAACCSLRAWLCSSGHSLARHPSRCFIPAAPSHSPTTSHRQPNCPTSATGEGD
jgi:hypothetical protein